ncbi:hypothetical protein [Nannocystis pusilla]|uniref:hypothetical protein n=1 Tax=Nannocystis pusilla TaxID=889268 RepID=UPI003BEFCB88
MSLDPNTNLLLLSVGYVVTSHLMARASLSNGTGRGEEPLTSDIADIMALFDPYADFYQVRQSNHWMRVRVADLNRRQEGRIGADFVLIMRGTAGQPVANICKLVLVQAKREAWGTSVYAASNNHVAKARAMSSVAGLGNSFFAYYHSDQVLTQVVKPWQDPPKFRYASPAKDGNQHYFRAQGNLPEGFLEHSFYRRHLLGKLRSYGLPPGYEWGIGLLGADYFINSAGQTQHKDLPPIRYVLQQGSAFGDFLVDLADCRKGTPRTDAEVRNVIASLRAAPVDNNDGAFDPVFVLLLEFGPGLAGDDNGEMLETLGLDRWRGH